MTATREQIVHKFLELKASEWIPGNWGLHEDRNYWNVGDDTYINGIPLIVDLDYQMGYLLEIVERSTGVVSYLVIVRGPHGHDSTWHDEPVGTFFDRSLDVFEAMQWGLGEIEGLLESMQQDQAPCTYDPRIMKGKPIGMFHCPECGEMVLAGLEHP